MRLPALLLTAVLASGGAPAQPREPAGDPGIGRRIADVRRLLEGSLPEDFPVQTLFETDLLDEAAVERRRGELAREIRDLTAGLAAPGGARNAARAAEARALEQRLQLARLRLAFLQKLPEERRRVNEAEERRRALELQHSEARRSQARAESEMLEAEAARRRASAEAGRASEPIRQAIAAEKARVESARAGIAAAEAELAARRVEEVQRARELLEEALRLEREARVAEPGSREADRLHGEIVAALEETRPLLRRALDEVHAPLAVSVFEPRLGPGVLEDPAAAAEATDLRERVAGLRRRAAAIEEATRAARWESLHLRAERFRRLNGIHLEVLPKLSRPARARVLGITREGVAQLGREIENLRLLARLASVSFMRGALRLPAQARDVFTVGAAAWALLKALLIAAVAVLLARRRDPILVALRRLLLRQVRSRRVARRLTLLVRFLAAVWAPALFLAALWAARSPIGEIAPHPALDLLYALLLAYGGYLLAIRAVHALVMQVAHQYMRGLDRRQSRRVLEAVRTLARVLFGIGVFLFVSERLLGRGFLFRIAARFGWIAVLGAVLLLLQRWRAEICDAYLRLSPGGWLADKVRATRERWQGFFVVLASFLILALRALLVLGRDLALGFEQTRRALAFLFRRRMERQAETSGYADFDPAQFPHAVLRAFTEEPLVDDRLEVDHYPGLARLLETLDRSAEAGCGGAFLLEAERGLGKTSWLRRTLREGALEGAVVMDLRRRMIEPRQMLDFVARHVDEDPSEFDRRLAEGPRRVLVIDQCHNLVLRAVSGYEALETFFSLVDRTQGRVFWLCTMNHHTWLHTQALLGANHPFREVQTLPAWDEESIRALIRRRNEASGLRLSYEDLLVEGMEGVGDGLRALETEQGYTRLLWDYADGNPRAALHFWLRSLVPDGEGAARVRLFRAPQAEELERLLEVERFLLAALMVHENLTVEEAAASSRYPRMACEGALGRLHMQGILHRDSDGRFRVTTHWHRALARFLKRVNLLVD